jgi:hypothetical protein
MIATQDNREARHGWAPGDYLCTCPTCRTAYIGAKRSSSCADCAYKLPATPSGPAVDPHFVFSCRSAVKTMREAGMNDTLIGCVLSEVRAAAIFEERFRIQALMTSNPPVHPPHGAFADAIKE